MPVKVLEDLFISNGPQCMVRDRAADLYFVDQTLFDHAVYPVVDAAMQLFFGKVQADLADVERAFPAYRCES